MTTETTAPDATGRNLAAARDFLAEHPDLEVFELIVPDLNGALRGKWVARDKLEKAFTGGLKLPLSTLCFDIWGRDTESLVWASGDGDGVCRGDARTLAPARWLPRPTGQLLMSLEAFDGSPCAWDCRTQVARLAERFGQYGLTPVVACEMEFHLLRDEPDEQGRPVHTQTDSQGGALQSGQTYSIDLMADMAPVMHAIRDACAAQGLPVDTLIKEAAPSQYEINLYHTADPLLAADQALMLKRVIRGVARQFSMRATFMAKPFGELAGNGLHLHCSLLDESGANVFNDGGPAGSDLLRHALAGTLATMYDAMLLFAPNLNSYRRFVRGCHAPLAPTWGYENRTVALRVPDGDPVARRLEHRVAGADANPYLVLAAVMAGMLHGLEQRLEAPEPLAGNAYDQAAPTLPRHWPDALRGFEQSAWAREYFGDAFVEALVQVKMQELDTVERTVTALEYDTNL